MADHASIARPYAQAIFDLAHAAGELAAWSELLHAAAGAVTIDEVAVLIGAPGIDAAELADLVGSISRVTVTDQVPFGGPNGSRTDNLLKLLAENGRLSSLPEIAIQFDALKTAVENRIDVTLTAATEVDESQQVKIAEALKHRFGRNVNLHVEVNENLIGGARLQADDLVIDGSVRTGLEKLARALVN